ncbi:hypothetical protein Tco_1568099 [Tanacetum coccineum]
MVLGRRNKRSLDYNNSFLGEYECSSLALDREEKRDEKEEIRSFETRSNNVSDQEIYIYRLKNPTVTAGGPDGLRYIWGPPGLSGGHFYHGSFFPSQMKMSETVVHGRWFTGCDSVVAVHRVWWVYPTSATGNEHLTARSSLISWKDIGMEGFVSRGAPCFFCQCETLRSRRLSAPRGQTMKSSFLHTNKSILFYPGAQDETKTTKVVAMYEGASSYRRLSLKLKINAQMGKGTKLQPMLKSYSSTVVNMFR